MGNPFDSARLTFGWAQHHIDVFKGIVEGIVNSKAWTQVIDDKSKPGKHIHKIKFVGELPETLPCILFDAANNLRAVLDQAGYASDNRGACEDLPPEITALFRGLKPYNGGNDTLWALHNLCNTKKHCALVPLYIPAPNISFPNFLP